MDPQPILPSAIDLERRRLENTIDHDLHSLSLGSLITSSTSSHTIQGAPRRISSPHDTSSSSMTSMSSIEYPRAFGEGDTGRPLPFDLPRHTHTGLQGPHGTPRAAGRKVSGMSARSIRSEFDSPVSTANHHVSAVTLGEGIFRTARGMEDMSTDEFDPERSLGRLVGELGKVMGGVSSMQTRMRETADWTEDIASTYFTFCRIVPSQKPLSLLIDKWQCTEPIVDAQSE